MTTVKVKQLIADYSLSDVVCNSLRELEQERVSAKDIINLPIGDYWRFLILTRHEGLVSDMTLRRFARWTIRVAPKSLDYDLVSVLDDAETLAVADAWDLSLAAAQREHYAREAISAIAAFNFRYAVTKCASYLLFLDDARESARELFFLMRDWCAWNEVEQSFDTAGLNNEIENAFIEQFVKLVKQEVGKDS